MNNVDKTVSRQWAMRPYDQRFISLEDLHEFVTSRAVNSEVLVTDTKTLKVYGDDAQNELVVNTALGPKLFTHWSFGQLANVAAAPGGYLRRLSSRLAADCMNEGLQTSPKEDVMILANGNDTLRCVTGPKYGRIWDKEVVEAVQTVTYGGAWKIPSASYASRDPKRATTLYASDRDVFIFLVDEDHPIELNGESLFRGFYTWNSEVGSQVFGLATFLYRFVCDNRMIWGMQHKNEIRIRHSAGAPARFVLEGQKALADYSQQSVAPVVEQIKRAQNIRLGKDEDEVKEFLRKRGMNLATADRVIEAAKIEEGDYNSAWAVANGITAAARAIQHTDTRVQMEREAGKLMDTVLNLQAAA